MKVKKNFQELDLSNAFLFAATMEDPELCKGVLERILDFPIRQVAVRSEKILSVNPDFRGVRLDVFADDEENSVFNIEMQTTNQGNLPKRSRYHQSQMDVQLLKAGSRFRDLKESYVIFICAFDPFGRGKYRYRFEEYCREEDLDLDDGTHKIFLNTEGTNPAEVSKELIQFLRYVVNSTKDVAEKNEDELLHKMHERVSLIKQNGEMEAQYMTLEDWMEDMFFEGKAEGRKEGHSEGLSEGRSEGAADMLSLISAMIEDGHGNDIPKLKEDKNFLEEMQKTYCTLH